MIESERGRLVIIDWDARAKPSEIYSLYKKTHGIRAASIFHSSLVREGGSKTGALQIL